MQKLLRQGRDGAKPPVEEWSWDLPAAPVGAGSQLPGFRLPDEAPSGSEDVVYDYHRVSRLAGELREPPEGDYSVEMVNLLARDRRR